MIKNELDVSLRTHILWERQEKYQTVNALKMRRENSINYILEQEKGSDTSTKSMSPDTSKDGEFELGGLSKYKVW